MYILRMILLYGPSILFCRLFIFLSLLLSFTYGFSSFSFFGDTIMRNKITLFCTLFCTLLFMPHTGFSKPAEEQKPLIIIILGAPGTGPGDLAVRVAEHYSIPLITPATLVGNHLNADTKIGEHARESFNSTGVISDDLILEMLYEQIRLEPTEEGMVLEGIPRTLDQAKKLFSSLSTTFRFLCLNVDVSDEALIARASGRLTCPNCGRVYHREQSPPDNPIKCDQCDHELIQRPKDTAEFRKKRLAEFHERATPMFAFLKENKIFQNLEGTKYVGERFLDDMFREIKKAVDEQNKGKRQESLYE
jgi:adenylate kinase